MSRTAACATARVVGDVGSFAWRQRVAPPHRLLVHARVERLSALSKSTRLLYAKLDCCIAARHSAGKDVPLEFNDADEQLELARRGLA